jgi:hypothetical protein
MAGSFSVSNLRCASLSGAHFEVDAVKPLGHVLAAASAAALFAGLPACGGGGDSDSLGPLWVATDVVVADVNGDGRNDVLTTAMYAPAGGAPREGRFLVYLQTTTAGVFAAPVDYKVGAYPWRMAIADIDGDKMPDVVITDADRDTAWLMLQDQARLGQFLAPQSLITAPYVSSPVIADLNGDGAPDVAIAGARQGLVIRYQDLANRGTFGPQVLLAMPNRPFTLAAGDIDGDGLDDVLAWGYTSPESAYPPTGGFAIAFQKPVGGFDVVGPLASTTGRNVYRAAIADLNADTRRDLFAFQTPWSSDFKAQLGAVPQAAMARAFDAPLYTSLAGVLGIDDAVLADLNQDGVPDAAVAGFFPTSGGVGAHLNLLMNGGQGYFALTAVIPMPLSVGRVSAGNLDGDGHNDIVLLGGDNECLVMFQVAPGSFAAPRALH